MPEDYVYAGKELELFAHAIRWKGYWSSILKPYLGREILEVGAGLGVNTELLHNADISKWVCLEPDGNLVESLQQRCRTLPDTGRITIRNGTVADLATDDLFDTILYIDVLEHIENDAEEMKLAAQHLRSSGRLIVLSPAHQSLFSAFDQSIGHFRRYSKSSLASVGPDTVQPERLFYLDAAGLLASLGNSLFLKQSMPTLRQITFWNNWLIPISRILDPLLRFRLGKTVVGVWRK